MHVKNKSELSVLKNNWVRHLILVLYLFQFLFITREYWRGTKDFFSIVANHSICKNKNQLMKFVHKFLCIYSILSIIFQSRAKTAMELLNELNDDVNGCYEDEVCIFFKSLLYYFGNINILNQF